MKLRTLRVASVSLIGCCGVVPCLPRDVGAPSPHVVGCLYGGLNFASKSSLTKMSKLNGSDRDRGTIKTTIVTIVTSMNRNAANLLQALREQVADGQCESVIGDTAEKMESARDHVDREFILKRWEAWNTGQHDNIEEEAGTEQTAAEAIKILKKMEQEWQQPRTISNSRARSLDEISFTSFVESISKLNISKTSEEAAKNGEAKRKKAQKGDKGTKSSGETTPGGGKEAMNGDSGENGKYTDEAENDLNRSAIWQKERRRNKSDGIANNLMGSEPTQQQTAEGIQQSLLNSVKDACEKMNGLMQSKANDLQIYNAANRSVPSSSLRVVTSENGIIAFVCHSVLAFFDVRRLEVFQTVDLYSTAINLICWKPSSNELLLRCASSDIGGNIVICDVLEGRQCAMFRNSNTPVSDLQWLCWPDVSRDFLASLHSNNVLIVWDVGKKERLWEHRFGTSVFKLSIDPFDHSRIALSSQCASVLLVHGFSPFSALSSAAEPSPSSSSSALSNTNNQRLTTTLQLEPKTLNAICGHQ
ncbi:hypothetical protein niasHT_013836 [Heterodera trifolii]|uniref:Uncharacterized protein n=1 Tax=Heterodera trifolii TaxID=157864 RepID=A0ABD2LEX9_9BILA